jgi:hypothetical protein
MREILRDLRARCLVAGVLVLAGCPRTHEDKTEAPHARGDEPAAPVASLASPESIASTTRATPAPDASAPTSAKLMADEAVGPFIAGLSENPGDFPSDNYVTNETSLLDVAPALRDEKLHGRAYVGVGPEQNFVYLAMLEPAVSYIVDIRRGNLLEHMFYRGCFEAGKTRTEFLSALLARRPQDKSGDDVVDAFVSAPGDKALRDEGIARTKALLDRLHVVRARGDDDEITRIHDAFFTRGLSLAYSMKGSNRKYPTLGDALSARDREGAPSSFLASDDSYARVRRLVLENRVLPVVGDFGGKHALTSVAADMRARGLVLGAFYASNVEQYLFDSHTYGNFVSSVAAMPRDDSSLVVRVWFDTGRAHPEQRPGHRTTQLSIGANAFLARANKTPFRSYWEVVTQPR